MTEGQCLTRQSTESIAQFYATVGKAIKVQRVISDLHQWQLAKLAGLDQATMSRIEAGKQQLHLHTLVAIAEALAVPVHSLLPEVSHEQ
jgi:transcriptional regulator with XRE-family HTH domain